MRIYFEILYPPFHSTSRHNLLMKFAQLLSLSVNLIFYPYFEIRVVNNCIVLFKKICIPSKKLWINILNKHFDFWSSLLSTSEYKAHNSSHSTFVFYIILTCLTKNVCSLIHGIFNFLTLRISFNNFEILLDSLTNMTTLFHRCGYN